MESLLELKETNNNADDNYKLVPWLNWEEWDFVRTSFFSSSSDSVAKSLRRIVAWRSRGCLPVEIEITASIVEIQQKDPYFRVDLSNGGSDSEEMLAMLYTMAIMRLVNGVIEKSRQKTKSIAAAAEEIKIPRMLIDIRHEGSHRELPSLRLLRLASVKALDWLKWYYWDPQNHAIPYQGGKSTIVRKEIRSKLCEMAYMLKVKQYSGSSSPQVKGNRSEKQITRTLKNLVRLYSFFSSDVVYVLLEFLLDASNSTDLMDSPDKVQIKLSLNDTQALFDEWKPVIRKVSKKEPELLLSLLNAVLDMIESRKITKDDFGSEHFSLLQYDSEMQRIGVLSSLFMQLVLVFKGLKIIQHEGEGRQIDPAGCLPKTSLVELVRRCLLISDPDNRNLLDSAMLLTEMVRDGYLSVRLGKLSSLTKFYPRIVEGGALDVNPNYLIQEEYIRAAAKKLELVKHYKLKKASVLSTRDDIMEDTNIWTTAKLWKPCPIGMLPRAVGSSGCLPALDHGINCEIKAGLNSMDAEKHLESKHSSKREASCDIETMNDSSTKRMKETQNSDSFEAENSSAITAFDRLKGQLLINGIWQKIRDQELQDIKSHIGILVPKRIS
ncbi:uncharacterized protein LOC104890105 isoform X2 [Beta vulgaris subsp. vulgaris]|uniref:uncharacterized protein LOC104890105 isoform X2 n=1 Tax=Beta vulgaris subsp. vulgaris TaxID=3555 RepID=UPI002036AE30|nr:uncharacterized protein LOC104890105 isoform X2 [Beta vulgaris subsp. vulgaris]